MSLRTFLSRLLSKIESLFDGVPAELKTAIHIGVLITENIKMFVDSPAADILTAIIPGDIDDEIKTLLRAKLPVILTELKLADSCGTLTDPVQITLCAVKILQQLSGDVKSAFLHNLSIFIAQVTSKGKLTWSDGVLILEWYYRNEYETAA